MTIYPAEAVKGLHPQDHPAIVYALHMGRTNIDLDDDLVERVMSRFGLPTKRATIDFALRQLDLEPMSREEALAMQGTGWEGDLDEMRRNWMRDDAEES
jgi:Arc/MetJ family transcription regulator